MIFLSVFVGFLSSKGSDLLNAIGKQPQHVCKLRARGGVLRRGQADIAVAHVIAERLLHTALCDYRGKIGNLAAQIASAGLDSTEADELWNRLGSLSGRLAAQISD